MPWASPKVKVLECEVGFYDAGGFDPGSEDVLLCGLVVSGSDPIQAVQVAGDGNTRGPWTRLWARPGHAPSEPSVRGGPSQAPVEKLAPPRPGLGPGVGGGRILSKSL